jgi:hypothetical protein
MRQQCTHIFDLTGLLMAHICGQPRREPRRRYLASMPDRERRYDQPGLAGFGPSVASLRQDGELVMQWEVDGDTITGPAPWGSRTQNRGFRAWTESLPKEQAEHATILRRAILVLCGRLIDLDAFDYFGQQVDDTRCYSSQPERRNLARRCQGATRDYSDQPDNLLANVLEIP